VQLTDASEVMVLRVVSPPFFSPGLEARMLSQMVSETQELIFPPASRTWPEAEWFDFATDRFSPLDLERFPLGRFIFQCCTINFNEKGILFGVAATLCGRLTATWLSWVSARILRKGGHYVSRMGVTDFANAIDYRGILAELVHASWISTHGIPDGP